MERDLLLTLLDWVRTRHYGKYRGVVVSNDDRTRRGRLKVKVPSVLGKLEVWAMPCVPYAGKGVGLMALPAPKTGVWIEFEGGDASFPIWNGCYWADKEAPAGGDPNVKIWKSESHTIRLDDGADEILVENGSEARITLAGDVTTEAGQATHSVGSSGVVSELGKGKVEVTPGSVRVNNGAIEVA